MATQDNTLRLRPRFKEKVTLAPDEIKQRIHHSLSENKDKWLGEIVDNHIILKIPGNQQHYWSPQLTLELEDMQGETQIRGLFGPKPGVWTMFVFFYSSVGFLTLMCLIFGLSQMTLKMDAYGLWFVPVGFLLLTGLFIMSKIGQRLSQEQMHQLNTLLFESLQGPIPKAGR